MKIQKILILLFAVVVTGGILAFSTWHQWSDNQKTVSQRLRLVTPIAEFNHGTSIKSIAFSPKNPDLVATAGEGKKVKIWNKNNPETPEIVLANHPTAQQGRLDVNYIAFSPIDEWFISKSVRMLSIWDVSTWETIITLNSENYPTTAEAISPANHLLAIANTDLTLWDFSNPNEIKGVVILPVRKDGQAISLEGISLSGADKVQVVKHFDGTLLNSYRSIDFSHDGKWIAASGKVHDSTHSEKWIDTVKVWDLQSKKLFKIIENITPDNPENSDDGSQSVNVPTDDGMRSIKSKSLLRDDIRSIKFSPDTRFFAVGAGNGLTIWSLPEWNIYHEILDQTCSDVAFSPDGKMFAVAGYGGIILWSVESLKPITILKEKGFSTSVSVVAFSHDGNTLAGGYYSDLWLWDMRKLNEK